MEDRNKLIEEVRCIMEQNLNVSEDVLGFSHIDGTYKTARKIVQYILDGTYEKEDGFIPEELYEKKGW